MAAGLGWAAMVCVIGFIVTPLVINPRAYDDAFFSPKWAWLASMGTLAVAALLGRALLGRSVRFPFDPIWIAALAFMAVNFLGITWARSRSLALERALHVGSLTLALWITLQAIRTRRAILILAWIWLAVAVAAGVWTLYQDVLRAWWPERLHITSNLSDWRGYLSSGLGNTNHIGDLLALGILVALVFLGESRRRLPLAVTMVAAVILAAALTVCYSVGSNFGLVLGGLVMLVLVLRREGLRFFRRRGRWIVLAALWAAMLAFFILDHPLNPHRPGILKQGFGSARWAEGGPTRLAIWAGGLEMVRLHPWLGVGTGNFTYVYPEMQPALLEGHPDLLQYEGLWTNAAHNILLQIWSELGIAGLASFVFLVALVYHSLLAGLRSAPRPEFLVRMTLAGVFTAFLAQGMMNFSLDQPSGAISIYLLLATVIAERAARRDADEGGMMPPLALKFSPLVLRVEWREMKRPLALAASMPLRAVAAAIGVILVLASAVAVLPYFHRPLLAQNEYALARNARLAGLPGVEEDHLLAALRYDPWATGCRSRYSEFLVERGRPAEALHQLEIVRQRLNSSELFDREARALMQLGRPKEAQEAWERQLSRLWALRHPSGN